MTTPLEIMPFIFEFDKKKPRVSLLFSVPLTSIILGMEEKSGNAFYGRVGEKGHFYLLLEQAFLKIFLGRKGTDKSCADFLQKKFGEKKLFVRIFWLLVIVQDIHPPT